MDGETGSEAIHTAALIKGKELADKVLSDLSRTSKFLFERTNVSPKLVIIQIGDNAESGVYIRAKMRAATRADIKVDLLKMDKMSAKSDIKKEIERLNNDQAVHGIIVQLPLPDHLEEQDILDTISPKKDVDSLTSVNIGILANLRLKPRYLPCTSKAIVHLLKSTNIELSGKRAVVIGRSNIVGLPTSLLLTREDATVTLCHSKTKNIEEIIKQADILVVAIGCLKYVQGVWIKPGAVVIDVGINQIEDSTKKSGLKLCGDVDFESAKHVASAITPVPGGVGPMTVAMLLENTVKSAESILLEDISSS